jgi:Uncharacterised ACR, YkgG family COG1556.
MDELQTWKNECKAHKMVDILNKKHFKASYAEDLAQAKQQLLAMLGEGASVAIGGSHTLAQMGMVETLRQGNYRFFDRYQKLPFDPDIVEIHRQALTADYLLTGTNAVTENGELVNTDCTGNRVAPMIFGPKHVIVVVGVNKLVKNIEAAFARIQEIAPMNSKRIHHETPCAESGFCQDCDCKKRICNFTTIIHNGIKFEGRISVIVVAEELGY